MYAFIKGTLFSKTPSNIVIDCNGVGYLLLIPASCFSLLPAAGEEAFVYTSHIVREQSQTLYGFITEEERNLFEQLIEVNGIGPKSALSLIGHLPPAGFHDAVRRGDVTLICKVPGIGKKTAERLLLDMKDKFSAKGSTPSDWQIQTEKDPRAQTLQDAMSALINLGYNQSTAEKALKKTLKTSPEEIELGMLITAALKNV